MEDVSDRYDPDAVEAEVQSYWAESGAYEAAKEAHHDDPDYFFVDGPPYTSGQMHLGTAWNKTLKDAIIRYKRMRGYDVADRPGYDMHGLPIEVKVEEELGFANKKDIEEFGVEAFIDECMDFAERNRVAMDADFESIGVWMDWENPYRTLSPEYMEAAWWAFQRVHERGLVEQGKRSISQCPRCETGIANNEVEYEDVEDPSIYVKFELSDRPGSLVIWTTTPWTIPGNTFVAVDGDLTYQAVEATKDGDRELLWIAAECVEEVLQKGRYDDYEVVDEVTGEEMVGWAYEHPLAEEVPAHPDGEGTLQVHTADYVEADRTGLVHSAPGHGEDDFRRGTELGLDPFCPVGGDGVFTDDAGAYAGTFVRDANPEICAALDEKGLLLADETYVHSYGHCWRCDTAIIQIVTGQWFITITDIKDELLENIEDSSWHPAWARDNRFRDFVVDAPDWNVSRQRYWGIPIPIWVPEDADPAALDEDMIVIGTREELAERVDQTVDPDEIDLHRPSVDDLTITENGTTYRRVPDVFDVWLDSSVATWGTLDYPQEEGAFEELWPADLIVEAHDQTRGWFWSQLGMGTAALSAIPYHEVLMHGHALDEDGRKMSKSVGNIVTPEEAIERAGADPLRVYLLSKNQQGADLRFEWAGLADVEQRLNILWNVFRFPLPYMELDGVEPAVLSVADADISTIDRWVLSRLQSVKLEMTERLDEYEIDDAVNALLSFVTDDVSRYYVKVIRPRMWEEEDSPAKEAAYATITTVLSETIRLLAPFAPHLAERMYQVLDGEAVTVHALPWPTVDEAYLDRTLESEVDVLRRVEEAAANARQQAERKLRWPISRMIVETEDDTVAAAVRAHEELLCDRVNAKSLELVEEWEELVEIAEPQMDVIGPAFGAQASGILQAVEGQPRSEIEAGVIVDGETVELDDEMVAYRREPPGNAEGTEFDGGTVYVDVALTEEIEAEGYAREIVRRIQEMRKRLDLDIEEPIATAIAVDDDRIAGFLDEWRAFVAEETRTEAFDDDADDLVEEWDVEGTAVTIGIERLNN